MRDENLSEKKKFRRFHILTINPLMPGANKRSDVVK